MKKLRFKRIYKDKLSFKKDKLITDRHLIHPYPGMLHPKLVDNLIDDHAKKNDIIFDPFCGSGVTLYQSNIKGFKSRGFDINPLALIIAKVKTTKYKIKKLNNDFVKIKSELNKNIKIFDKDIPNIKNKNYWYSKKTINDIATTKKIIKSNELNYLDFFLIILAYSSRDQSFTRNGEFKRYKMNKNQIEKFNFDFKDRFLSHCTEMIKKFSEDKLKSSSKVTYRNSEKNFERGFNYDLVITSPPYGDSKTTIAYGEYSSFGSEWILDLTEYKEKYDNYNVAIDKASLGGNKLFNAGIQPVHNCEELNNLLAKINVLPNGEDRSNEVLSFFMGYYKVLKNLAKNLNKNGKIIIIVGNRLVKNIAVPMDQITASFLQDFNLKFEKIETRNISRKKLPLKNSPTGKTGNTQKTMLKEYIVIFSK